MNHIILFDGVCNLCSNAVQFIIKREKNELLKFASLQSKLGTELLKQHYIDPNKTDSIVYIKGNNAFVKSDAALEISKELKMPWSWLAYLSFIPTSFRDLIYEWVAINRYKWFGKKESCMIPKPELRSRFLDL
jgi:predicted DCC family thiol-disulfide oxidoreductase YuxK